MDYINDFVQSINDLADALSSMINHYDLMLKIMMAAVIFSVVLVFIMLLVVTVINGRIKNIEEDLFKIRENQGVFYKGVGDEFESGYKRS